MHTRKPDWVVDSAGLDRPNPARIYDYLLLDFRRPMALTITGVLYYVLDDDLAHGATRRLIGALSPGSWVVINHLLLEEPSQGRMEKAIEDYKRAGNTKARTRQEIARFFEGVDLVEPGLVFGPLWRPEGPEDLLKDRPEDYLALAGVGRKR